MKKFIRYKGNEVPKIVGAKGGKGGGKISPNSLFSTDILYVTTALGEGPVYRINPNGPQDIQINDSSIDDLINLNSNGLENTDKFLTVTSTGTVTQDPLPKFGDEIVTPQIFASPVTLKKGNLQGIPASKIELQETSANDWDAIRFNFVIDELLEYTDKGDVRPARLAYRIRIYNSLGTSLLITSEKELVEKTDSPYKFSHTITIPKNQRSTNGYRISIDKTSNDTDNPKYRDVVKALGWDELKYTPQAYPRTALIGYAIKAMNEHTGGIPNFTSLLKGLLIKVPSNYNQPVLANGDIDWRELEVGTSRYTSSGYRLQKPGASTVLTAANPVIYTGTWDGTFVYSWSQNPVWIIYDILTNKSYGLGIPEENIDKYKFYQIAQYCDACDDDGRFLGVPALADGSFRYKPRNSFTRVKENQVGLAKGSKVSERRFIMDVTISDQEKAMDTLNKITATFRGMLIYAGGKVSLAVDMPDEYPVMLFNETNVKQGSFQISGVKESEVYTGVDITYIEPTNHYKREVVRLDLAEANDGREVQAIENIAALDLTGVTRRSQAIRLGQYQIAASRYMRRNIAFVTSTDALNLAPGDVISVAMNGTGIAYGYGGKVSVDSTSNSSNVYVEHYTIPPLAPHNFTANNYPIAMRIVKQASDRSDLYLLSATDFSFSDYADSRFWTLYTYWFLKTDMWNSEGIWADEASWFDEDLQIQSSSATWNNEGSQVRVKVISRFDPITKRFVNLNNFTANNRPSAGDLWTIGEIEDTSSIYRNKAGKLFKVTGIQRDSTESEVSVSAVEYLSEIYVDSDNFIDYEPTAYTDITSPFSIPPAPTFTFTARPAVALDGSLVVEGVINNRTESLGYPQKYETEYYLAKPAGSIAVANVISSSTFSTPSSIPDTDEVSAVVLAGKNGFTTPAGDIKLLCTAVKTIASGAISLTLEGLNLCIDENFNNHVLAINDGFLVPSLKGRDRVALPIQEKYSSQGLVNFVGYASDLVSVTREIIGYDIDANSIIIDNPLVGSSRFINALTPTPFYVSLNQILAKGYYSNRSIYIRGTEIQQLVEGDITGATTIITLPSKPRTANSVRLYVNGRLKSTGQYTLNTASGNSSTIRYTRRPGDVKYRVEIDYYTVPTIEAGDTLEVSYGNSFTVVSTSYDKASSTYDAALTDNYIYRIILDTAPQLDLTGFSFINTTEDPSGVFQKLSSNTFTIAYNADNYPGVYRLANAGIYSVEFSANYERLFLENSLIIPSLSTGLTSIKARNKNTLGRTSAYVTRSVYVEPIPIQAVDNLLIEESLYREQTGGVAVRITCSFDHIVNQEVTDYEISYKFTSIKDVGTDDGGNPLTAFNTAKVPASGVDSDDKIRFTINNVNRGDLAEANSIILRVTPLNKSIKGITATAEKNIIGKIAPPLNVRNFTGGQQNELVTLFWSYVLAGSELFDLDLKEVIIRKAAGVVVPSIDSFINASPIVTAAAPTTRVSIPIETYGEYTYLARTRDTSGNYSDSVVATTISTSRPQRSTVVAAYSEDDPPTPFNLGITNNNSLEDNFPSFVGSSSGGLAYINSSIVDNANGTSSGWSALARLQTDLLAPKDAVYVTQIRDFGQVVTGQVDIDIQGEQELQFTYNDQQQTVIQSVTDPSSTANVLLDTSFGGIGHVLGFANASVISGRYDANNATWMTGNDSGNVWAISNPGQFIGDTANVNSYALIAGLINANAIALGSSYYANGVSTGGNAFASITTGNNAYRLVNLLQYNDTGTGDSTYAGILGAVTSQTLIRTTTEYPYYANGNVNSSAFNASGDGYAPYERGTKSFRYFQIKYIVNNNKPDEYDFTLDKFRYIVDKEQTLFTATVDYDSNPKTVDISSAKFLTRPVINYAVLDQRDATANPAIVVTTAASKSSLSFRLLASDGTGQYAANSTATVMITAIGV